MRKQIGKVKNIKTETRLRRKLSIRKKVSGTSDKPRICVTKTNKHLSVQVVDDTCGVTILSCQTFGKNAVPGASKNLEGAKVLGKLLADQLKEKKLTTAVFDRNGYRYIGLLQAMATSLRDNGITI